MPSPSSTSDTVLYNPSLSTAITTIIINRPSARNAVNTATATLLYQAFLRFESDPTQKVCVFHGANGMFCAGADLKELSTRNSSPDSTTKSDNQATPSGRVTPQSDSTSRWNRETAVKGRNQAPMGPSRLIVSKPVIAAVQGYAVAGGLELSLIADIRVVEEDAIFGVFCRRWGVPLIDGGTVKLQRVVGLGRAMDMILTGRGVGAREAREMGLANRVVPKGKAVEVAMEIATQLVGFPQECMNVDRRSAYFAAYEVRGFEEAMRFEFENGVKVVDVESVKGAARFLGGAGRHGGFEGKSKL